MKQASASTYLPQLDGLRALAIVMVFLHHACHVPFLWAGVDLFFILSGYLITNILLRDSERMSFRSMLGRFYTRRAERILPAYLTFVLLAWAVFHIHWGASWPYYVFFSQNVPYAFNFAPAFILAPLWSLGVEQHFYLIWPLLVFFAPRRLLPWLLGGLILAEPIIRALCTPLFASSEAIYALTPFRLDTMAFGALCAVLLPRCNPRRMLRWTWAAMAGSLIVLGVLAAQPWYRRGLNNAAFNSSAYSLNMLILGGLFVWAVLSDPHAALVRVLSNRILRWLARISYMFYLLHLAMLSLLLEHAHLRPELGIPLAFALTAALATASWYAIEKPILSLSASHRKAAPRTPVAS